MTALRRFGGPLLGLAISVGLLAASRGLDDVAREGQLGPGFWPRLVLAGLALACVARIVEAWRAGPASARVARPEISRVTLLAAIVLIVAYVAGTPAFGFPLATAAFIAGFMVVGGARSAPGIIAAAGLGTVVLLYLFVKVVYLPLPKGDLIFETVTIALYRALRIF